MDHEILKKKVSEYFSKRGYAIEINTKVASLSGGSRNIDVLAIDKEFNEVKIACECIVSSSPIGKNLLLSWIVTCEDLGVVPALASTTNYTDSVLKTAEKHGCILMFFDKHKDVIYKVDNLEEFKIFLENADSMVNKAQDSLTRLIDLVSEEKRSEAKKMREKVELLFGKAESLYKKSLKLNPTKHAWLKLGKLYELMNSYPLYIGKQKEAIKCYVNALKEHMKEFPEILKELGLSSHKLELQRRIEELFNFSFIYPWEYTRLHWIRFRRIEHFQISLLRMYLEKCPEDVSAWLELAGLYVSAGQLSEAEKTCEKVLKISPENSSIYSRTSTLYSLMAERSLQTDKRPELLKKAIQLQKRSCELESDLSARWMDLARVYERIGDLQRAINSIEEAMKRRGAPHWTMWKRLGDLYFRKGEKGKALDCYAKAIDARLKFRQDR